MGSIDSVSQSNPEVLFNYWHIFSGPEGTCFEGGVFPAKLVFPPDYPLSPPKMKFTCEMFHPNSKSQSWLILFVFFVCILLKNKFHLQYLRMAVFAFQSYMRLAMIQWVTNYRQNDGVQCKVLRRFFWVSCLCWQVSSGF